MMKNKMKILRLQKHNLQICNLYVNNKIVMLSNHLLIRMIKI